MITGDVSWKLMKYLCELLESFEDVGDKFAGTGTPAGIFPRGGRGREENIPASINGDGGGELLSPRGRGWRAIPRRGIPGCHP
jgi:hypothetical protein